MENNMCCRAYFALALALSLIASLATAQTVLPSLRRPSEQTLPLPEYQPRAAASHCATLGATRAAAKCRANLSR
jgi:hypothetical protein